MRSFGEIIKSQRQKLKLTQKQVADSIGITDAYICSLESGKKIPPPFPTVAVIAKMLRLDVDQLWKAAVKRREEQAKAKSRRKTMIRRGDAEPDDSLPQHKTAPDSQINAFFARPDIQLIIFGLFKKQPVDMTIEEKRIIFRAINQAQESILE